MKNIESRTKITPICMFIRNMRPFVNNLFFEAEYFNDIVHLSIFEEGKPFSCDKMAKIGCKQLL